MKFSIHSPVLLIALLTAFSGFAHAGEPGNDRIVDRSLASVEPRWHQDAKAFESLEEKPEAARIRAESDGQLAQSFQKSPYLNYNR